MGAIQIFNAARMAAIEALAVVGAAVVGDNLVMTRKNGSTFIAGNVRGNPGTMTAAELQASIEANLATTGLPLVDAVTAVRGVSTKGARSDHVHPVPTWTAYTPTLSGMSLGNGTINGRYMLIGKMVFIRITINAGSTTTYSGVITVGLPVAAVTGVEQGLAGKTFTGGGDWPVWATILAGQSFATPRVCSSSTNTSLQAMSNAAANLGTTGNLVLEGFYEGQ